jgi:hypothetical protein
VAADSDGWMAKAALPPPPLLISVARLNGKAAATMLCVCVLVLLAD